MPKMECFSPEKLQELKNNLQTVHGRLAGGFMREALTKAAGVYKSAIEEATPVGRTLYAYEYRTRTGKRTVRAKHKPGAARAAVIIYERRGWGQIFNGDEQVGLLVGHAKKDAYYMYWWEYGNKRQPAKGTIRRAAEFAHETALDAARRHLENRMQEPV
jgi:hypothetical protein